MDWVNVVVQGVLAGGLFALLGAGLSVVFGVMRVANLAHGDFSILATFIAVSAADHFGLNPAVSLLIATPILFAIGYGLQLGVLNGVLERAGDATAAQYAGVNTRRTYASAFGIGLAVAGIAGIFLGIRTSFGPFTGPVRLTFAFEAVAIGGLGSLWGTFWGGILLGIAQASGAQLNPGWGVLAGHLLFLAVIAVRPQGLRTWCVPS